MCIESVFFAGRADDGGGVSEVEVGWVVVIVVIR